MYLLFLSFLLFLIFHAQIYIIFSSICFIIYGIIEILQEKCTEKILRFLFDKNINRKDYFLGCLIFLVPLIIIVYYFFLSLSIISNYQIVKITNTTNLEN